MRCWGVLCTTADAVTKGLASAGPGGGYHLQRARAQLPVGHFDKALLLRYYKLNHIQGVCIKKMTKKSFINRENLAITDTLSQVSMKICGMITSLQTI